jgi:hypothetical protein
MGVTSRVIENGRRLFFERRRTVRCRRWRRKLERRHVRLTRQAWCSFGGGPEQPNAHVRCDDDRDCTRTELERE